MLGSAALYKVFNTHMQITTNQPYDFVTLCKLGVGPVINRAVSLF